MPTSVFIVYSQSPISRDFEIHGVFVTEFDAKEFRIKSQFKFGHLVGIIEAPFSDEEDHGSGELELIEAPFFDEGDPGLGELGDTLVAELGIDPNEVRDGFALELDPEELDPEDDEDNQ